jgi:hypothetical protein
MTWPTFLFLGAPRSGTTQLYEGLRQHPEIFMSAVKEPLYFVSPRYRLTRVEREDEYQALFAEAGPARAVGEASTLYLYDPEAPARIRAALPEVRLIAILRHPVERAYSQYVFERLLQHEVYPTFEQALAAEPDRRRRGDSPFLYYLDVGRYAAQIRRYQALFAEDHLLWLLHDDLRHNQADTFRRIFRFLDVDPAFTPDLDGAANQSGVPRHPSLYRWLHRTARPLKAWMPDPWVQRLRREADQALLQEAPAVAPETRRRLVDDFRDDIVETARLIGRDLGHWLAVSP